MALPPVLSGRRRRCFAYLVANGLAQAAVAVALALLVKHGFDRLVAPPPEGGRALSPGLLAQFAGGLGVTLAAAAWLRWRSHLDAEQLGQGYVHAVRMTLFRHVGRLGAEGLRRMSRGAVMLRFVGDLTALRQWISLGLARLTVSGLATLLALAILAFVEPVVALAVAVAVTVAATLALAIGPRLRLTTREVRRRRGQLAATLNDRLAHIGVVEAFGQERREARRFEILSRRLRHALITRARVIGLLRALSEASGSLAGACALLVGASQVALGHASPGAVVAAMVVAGLLAPRLQDLGRVYEYWNGAVIAREKQEALLALQPPRRRAPDRPARTLAKGPGRLVLDGVTLEGLLGPTSLTVEPGRRVALVGPNGAGKSRLLRVMAGLAPPDRGSVRLDGQRLDRCRWAELRRAVALVAPDLPLLRGSLRFNLTYGAPGLDDAALLRALGRLGLDDLPGRLPQGLDSRIAESGAGLSSGERARIALARALLAGPRLLLLDEPDANLDRDAAETLRRCLADFTGTVVLVTHDPAIAATADRVLRLEAGRLVESPAADAGRSAAPVVPIAGRTRPATDPQQKELSR